MKHDIWLSTRTAIKRSHKNDMFEQLDDFISEKEEFDFDCSCEEPYLFPLIVNERERQIMIFSFENFYLP